MVRASGKHTSARLLVICIGLLGIALVADFFWASSPRFSSSYLSQWPSQDKSQTNFIVPSKTSQHEIPNKVKLFSFLSLYRFGFFVVNSQLGFV